MGVLISRDRAASLSMLLIASGVWIGCGASFPRINKLESEQRNSYAVAAKRFGTDSIPIHTGLSNLPIGKKSLRIALSKNKNISFGEIQRSPLRPLGAGTDDVWAWSGTSKTGESATLVVTRNKTTVRVRGIVYTKEGTFELRHVGGDVTIVTRVDFSKLKTNENTQPIVNKPTLDDDGKWVTIDVIVGYTTTVAALEPCIQDEIELAVEDLNGINRRSGVHVRFNLADIVEVHGADVDKIEDEEDDSSRADHLLQAFANEDDKGSMYEIHQRRDSSYADLSVLLYGRHSPNAQPIGLRGLSMAIAAHKDQAYSVVYYDQAVAFHTFAHEIGHLMGASHNTAMRPAYDWARGYRDDNGLWCTVVTVCDGLLRIPHWSNPKVFYWGARTGLDGSDETHEVTNNAMILNGTAKMISGYRQRPTADRP